MAEKMIINKRGQMTIWIMVALIVVALIILFFVLRGKVAPSVEGGISENPQAFISACVKNNVNEAVGIMLPQGGFISPEHTKTYKDIKVAYLCYNAGNYNPCVNEHPMLLGEIKDEIKRYIEPKIEQCFEDYKNEMKKRNADVALEPMELNIELGIDKVYINIDRKVSISEKENILNFEEFNTEIINPIYDLGRVAMEIASQEAKFCYFEYVGYMILYPKFKINVDTMSDSTKIYTIEDKKSNKVMNIAIRSCAIPSGL